MLMRFRSGAVWLSLVAMCATTGYGGDEAEPGAKSATLKRVFAAWNARQARIQAFHVTWDLRIRLPRGYALPRGRGVAGLQPMVSEPNEDRDVELTLPQSEWWGEGADRLRSDFGEFAPSGAGGWKEAGQLCLVADGSRNLRLRVPASAEEQPTLAIWRKVPVKNPSNTTSGGDFLLPRREADLRPLGFALRPARAASEWSPENCRVVSENAFVNGVRCIGIQMDKIDHSERCWVDPSRDYSVVRWESPGSAPIEIAIDAHSGGNREWVPSQWSWSFVGVAGVPPTTFEVKVTSFTILKKLPEGTFSPTGPPGTRVFDATVDLPILDTGEHSGMEPPQKAGATLAAIAEAWMRRQAAIKSLKFGWRREGLSLHSYGDFRMTLHSVAVDGEKFASTLSTPGWTPRASLPAMRAKDGRARKVGCDVYELKDVHDGVTWSRLSFSERPGDAGDMSISDDPGDRESLSRGDWSVMLVYRPLHPKFGCVDPADLRDPTKFHVVSGTKKIGDVACVVIENEPHEGAHEYYWLDPARDYLPLRESRTLNGEDRGRVDFKYRLDSHDGWVPAGWTGAYTGESGSLLASHTNSVTEATLNRPLPALEFEIDPPTRARVSDSRGNRRSPRERAEDAARSARETKLVALRQAKLKAHKRHRPIFDPFADAAADLEAAEKSARDTKRRVLIEFGMNPDFECYDLWAVLKENPEVAPVLNQNFVLLLVAVNSDTGKAIQEKYVPQPGRYRIPYLSVLDSDGNLIKNDNTTPLAGGDDYDIGKVKNFLAEWSPGK